MLVIIGVDFGEIVDLELIYFDYNKWDICLDVKIELNKIVKIMNDNLGIYIEFGLYIDSCGMVEFNQCFFECCV